MSTAGALGGIDAAATARRTWNRFEALCFEGARHADDKCLLQRALRGPDGDSPSTGHAGQSLQPTTFVLPEECDAAAAWLAEMPDSGTNLLFFKSSKAARGRGVVVLPGAPEASAFLRSLRPPFSHGCVLQEAVDGPLLLSDRHKCDLRLYVLLAPCESVSGASAKGRLTAHVYTAGHVRRALLPYSKTAARGTAALEEVMGSHLTNFSVHARVGEKVMPRPT